MDKIASSGVFDIDSIGLIKLLRRMNQGLDVAGNTIGAATDFLIEGPEAHGVAGLVNLFGIESPGLTASLAIADEVAARLGG